MMNRDLSPQGDTSSCERIRYGTIRFTGLSDRSVSTQWRMGVNTPDSLSKFRQHFMESCLEAMTEKLMVSYPSHETAACGHFGGAMDTLRRF
jgi:hypothetical protein